MNGVTLVFSRRHHPGSALLRLAMWSPWSHVGIVDPRTGHVIEAVAGRGVIQRRLDDVIATSSRYELVALPASNPAAVIDAALQQLGKRYDWWGVIGLGVRRQWQQDDAWFCSELAASAFAAAGEPLFRADCLRRVTPQHLWMLAPWQEKGRLVPA